MVLSYLETLLPPIFQAVPGIKIGLPNVIIVFILYRFSLKDACAISLIKVLSAGILFGNAMTLLYSFSGAVLSLAVMFILKKTEQFSLVGVSIAGGVSHNLGQIIAAIFLLQSAQIGYYMIVLAISGVISGTIIGLLGAGLLKSTEKIKLFNQIN
ncbi:MAG: Gx transporter family protein [Clostridia bacterium]|nr:Gx transporter family protein [Clostridia bacterium]